MAPRYRIRKKAASAEPATPEHPEPATARPKIITRLVKAQRAVQLINQLKTEDPALCSSPRLKVSYLRARANMKLLKYEQKPELCDRLCFEVLGILDNLLYNEDYLADIKTEAAMIAAHELPQRKLRPKQRRRRKPPRRRRRKCASESALASCASSMRATGGLRGSATGLPSS